MQRLDRLHDIDERFVDEEELGYSIHDELRDSAGETCTRQADSSIRLWDRGGSLPFTSQPVSRQLPDRHTPQRRGDVLAAELGDLDRGGELFSVAFGLESALLG